MNANGCLFIKIIEREVKESLKRGERIPPLSLVSIFFFIPVSFMILSSSPRMWKRWSRTNNLMTHKASSASLISFSFASRVVWIPKCIPFGCVSWNESHKNNNHQKSMGESSLAFRFSNLLALFPINCLDCDFSFFKALIDKGQKPMPILEMPTIILFGSFDGTK